MPSDFHIHCADCGKDYRTNRKNTKYCRVCRIARNLDFFGQRTQTCWKCEEKFAPFESKQVMCGKCCYKPAACPEGTCAICRTDGKLLHEDIAVCWECALRTDKRAVFLRAIVAKVGKRSAEAAA